MVKYDLGGMGRRDGYVTVNLVPGADRQCDMLDLDAVNPNDEDVDEFLLVHTLEHVPSVHYLGFLTDLYRKLRSGGQVIVVQTDASLVIKQYTKGELSFRSMRSTLFPPEDRLRLNPLNAHYNMWSADELARDFRASAFHVETFDGGAWVLDTEDSVCPADLHTDQGKLIKNLGVRATKP